MSGFQSGRYCYALLWLKACACFLLFLSTVLQAGGAPGTVLTLSWQTKGHFVIKVPVSGESGGLQSNDDARLLVPAHDTDSLAITAAMALQDGFIYRIETLTDTGTAQIFAVSPFKLALSKEFKPKEEEQDSKKKSNNILAVAAYTYQTADTDHKPTTKGSIYISDWPNSVELFTDEKTELPAESKLKIIDPLKKKHIGTRDGEIDGQLTVHPYPAFIVGKDPMIPGDGILLTSLLPPTTETSSTPATVEQELIKALEELKLEGTTTDHLKQFASPEQLQKVKAAHSVVVPVIFKYLSMQPSQKLEEHQVSLAVLMQAFKDSHKAMEDVPMHMDGSPLSEADITALSAVFENTLLVSSESDERKQEAEEKDDRKDNSSSGDNTDDEDDEPTTSLLLPKHENQLYEKLTAETPPQNYDGELQQLLTTLWGEHMTWELFHEPMTTDAAITRKGTPSIQTPKPDEIRIYIPESDERLRAYGNALDCIYYFKPLAGKRPLPFPPCHAGWAGQKLYIIVVEPRSSGARLNEFHQTAGNSFASAIVLFQAIATALHDAFEYKLLIPQILPEHILVSTLSQGLFGRTHQYEDRVAAFTSTPYSYCTKKQHTCSPPVKDIQNHMDQMLQLYLWLRTGKNLEEIRKTQALIGMGSSNPVSSALEEFKTSPAETWRAWLSAAGSQIEAKEIKLIEAFKDIKPDWRAAFALRQTINSVIPLRTAPAPPQPMVQSTKLSPPASSALPPAPSGSNEPEQLLATQLFTCKKGHSLTQVKRHSISTTRSSRKSDPICDGEGCIGDQTRGKSKPLITNRVLMHCSECNESWCMSSCAKRAGVGFIPWKVSCPENHPMTLIPGKLTDDMTNLCDSQSCHIPNKQITHYHHFTCNDCYSKPRLRNVYHGFDYCLKCAETAAILTSHPTGRSGHIHPMDAVKTQTAGRHCSKCGAANPVDQYRYQCKTCIAPPLDKQENLCLGCAGEELHWYMAGQAHTRWSKR